MTRFHQPNNQSGLVVTEATRLVLVCRGLGAISEELGG